MRLFNKKYRAKVAQLQFRCFIITCIISHILVSCATVPVHRLEKTKQKLSSDIKINRLPFSAKLLVDERTKNWTVAKRPSTFAGSANIIKVPVGQQFLKGVNHASKLVFQNVTESDEYDVILEISIANFYLNYRMVMLFMQDGIEYEMAMSVQSKLLKKDGSILYQKTQRVAHEAVVGIGLFHGLSVFHETLSEGNAILTSLWVKDFVKEISEDQNVLNLAKKVSVPDEINKLQGPEIVITNPMEGTSIDQNEIMLSGSIRADSPIKEHHISLNGRLIPEMRGISIVTKNNKKIRINRKIKIPIGENIISITAMTEAGVISQKVIRIFRAKQSLETVASLNKDAQIGERFAVVVGISTYKNSKKGIPELHNAANDALAFAEFLKSSKGGGFDEEKVLLLLNEQANSKALRRALFTYLKKAIEEDLVIFFFSGQGAPEPGSMDNYYLLTYDADPDDLPATAIPTWDVNIAFQRYIKARRAVVIVDASHISEIGKISGFRSSSNQNLINRYLKELSKTGEGKVFFSATQEGQTSVKPRSAGIKTGLFTHYLLEGLAGAADENGDSVITLGEVIDYTIDLVSAASRGKQRPEVTGKFDRDLPFAVLK